MNVKDLNIGHKINEVRKMKRISPEDLAQKLNCHKSNLYKIFQKENVDLELLMHISKILEFDFFAYISEVMNETEQLSTQSNTFSA
ncbi:MAG: helix-turn-helix transcriptional regulator [Marinilabiliaceae bacterium]|nr:helix-turn-helix transcriptional regulator [Marinilabiliaceae bacterium]